MTLPRLQRARALLILCALLALPALACERATLPTPVAGDALLTEDFGDQPHQWDIFTDDPDMSARIDTGRLILAVNVPDQLTWSVLQDSQAVFSDCVLEVDATPLAGPTDNSYGVVFRYGDRFNFYSFEISADGWYRVRARRGQNDADTQMVKLIDWTQSSAILTGIGQSNHLGVTMQGNQFTLAVNGETIARFSDATFVQGRVGVIAGSYQEPNVQVAFDNLTVKKP